MWSGQLMMAGALCVYALCMPQLHFPILLCHDDFLPYPDERHLFPTYVKCWKWKLSGNVSDPLLKRKEQKRQLWGRGSGETDIILSEAEKSKRAVTSKAMWLGWAWEEIGQSLLPSNLWLLAAPSVWLYYYYYKLLWNRRNTYYYLWTIRSGRMTDNEWEVNLLPLIYGHEWEACLLVVIFSDSVWQ